MKHQPSHEVSAQDSKKNLVRWWWLGLQAEFALFRRPMLVLSVLAIILAPSLYAVFYISSFWDPYGNLDRLPAALVNADHGAVRGGRSMNLGDFVLTTFERQPPFRFVHFSSVAAADAAMRRGEVYFTLIIPGNFSERAFDARQDEPANITLHVAEGVNYTSAVIGKRFGDELAHMLNEQLNRERWGAIIGDRVMSTNRPVRTAISQLRDGGLKIHEAAQRLQVASSQLDIGLGQVSDGAQRLAEGTGQFIDAATGLSDGMGRIGDGVQEIRDRLPPENQLLELAAGSRSAVAGDEKIAEGLDQMLAGDLRLDEGAGQLQREAGRVPFGGHRLSAGAAQLESGIAQLGTNLAFAANGGHELQAGLERLDGGIQPLTKGLAQFEQVLQTMIPQLPTAEQRTRLTTAAAQLREAGAELTNGLARLRDGSYQLADGSKEFEAKTAELAAGLNRLQSGFEQLEDADAAGLAASVHLNIETTAPVPNNGTAFSPYFTALALWLGGIMMTFVFHFRRLIEPLREAPRPARWLAKVTVPAALGILQATVIVLVLHLALGIAFAHPWQVWLAAILGSLAFVSVIQLFIVLFGDAGRLVAVVLLILQLAAAGGIYPVELSGRFYQAIHPLLPLTALVNGFRATMFAAFDGTWWFAAAQLAVTACGAAFLAIWLARWKYVPSETYGPAVEFS